MHCHADGGEKEVEGPQANHCQQERRVSKSPVENDVAEQVYCHGQSKETATDISGVDEPGLRKTCSRACNNGVVPKLKNMRSEQLLGTSTDKSTYPMCAQRESDSLHQVREDQVDQYGHVLIDMRISPLLP